MKKWTKKLSVVLCMMLFMALAIGSTDEDNEKKTTSTEVKAENDKNSNSSKKVESSNNTNASTSDTDAEESSKGLQYEITDSRFEYYKNSIGKYEYYGIVEVTNTGDCDMYMSKCTFDLEDNDGHLLQSDSWVSSCPEVVSPGEKGYFYNGIGSNQLDDAVSLDNGVKLVPQITISKAKKEAHFYPISDLSVKEDKSYKYKITGRVENDTDEEIGMVYVNYLFFDANGKILSISGVNVTKVAPGTKGSFDTNGLFMNDNIKFADIAETKAIAQASYYQYD